MNKEKWQAEMLASYIWKEQYDFLRNLAIKKIEKERGFWKSLFGTKELIREEHERIFYEYIKQILEEKKAMKGVCKIITKQKTIKCFRWVTKDMKSEHGNMKWELGKWNKIDCKLLMCNSGLHAYTDSFDSMNNVFGDKWFISEARGVIKDKDSTKICCSEMRLIKEIPEMAWKRFALFCAKDCLKFYDKEYPSDKRVSDCIKAAEDFLDGKIDEIKLEKHRSAAGSAARSAARSAELAESAWSAWSAESAAWSARSAGSATRSAWSAAW